MEKRESNFELLRIILIIMIIILHYLSASIGGALTNTEAETINYYLIQETHCNGNCNGKENLYKCRLRSN